MASEIEIRQRVIAIFPELAHTQFELTSPATPAYNCIAWAAGDDRRWWWPTKDWPVGASREVTRESFIEAFESRGYEVCQSAEIEAGFEKVALYEDADGVPTHAARLLPDGMWTSKLGQFVDISHTLEGLNGDQYGQPALFMRRPSAIFNAP